jgi:ubiquitin C-terminal hydrolase
MRIHEKLKEETKYNNNNYIPSQENEMDSFNYFQNAFFTENKSIISDLFYGILGTKYECNRCHIRKYNYQSAFFYVFPLEEIRKHKIEKQKNLYLQHMQQQMQFNMMQMGQNMFMYNNMNYMNNMNLQLMCQPYFIQLQNINSVNINDCFEYYQKIEVMSGDNAMHCNYCKRQEDAFYQTYIVNSPEIIIIILNRGKGIEFNVKLEFYEFLNLQSYVKNYNGGSFNYKLIGVVTHLGESGASGHFIAYCRSPIDDKWYNYNDDLCFDVDNFQKQVIDYAMPYILFYQRQ